MDWYSETAAIKIFTGIIYFRRFGDDFDLIMFFNFILDMYSDSSSSTTSTESDENFPGYIPVPMSEFSDMLPGDKTKLYQAYRGQLKVSAYINYGLLTVHSK